MIASTSSARSPWTSDGRRPTRSSACIPLSAASAGLRRTQRASRSNAPSPTGAVSRRRSSMRPASSRGHLRASTGGPWKTALLRSGLFAGGDPEEGLPALLVTRGAAVRLGVLLLGGHLLLGALELLLQVARVELVGVDGLLDEQQHAVARHLDVALALREADDVGLGHVEPQLGRLEEAQQRLVPRQDADRADAGPGRDLLDL